VIGAPLHTDFSLSGGRYETGRVYVVYQNREVRYCCYSIQVSGSGSVFGIRIMLAKISHKCTKKYWIRIRIKLIRNRACVYYM
jgi:hypothetical protein